MMTDNNEIHWRKPPPVEAPSPDDREKIVHFRISDDLTGVGRRNWRRTPLFWVWTHLHNQLPPIPNVGIIGSDDATPTLSTLHDSTGCFQGVNRPYLTEDDGHSVLTYILKPSGTVEYVPRMAAPIKAFSVPKSVVFTVQVRLTEPLQVDGIEVCGIVSRIEPVACDEDNGALPQGL